MTFTWRYLDFEALLRQFLRPPASRPHSVYVSVNWLKILELFRFGKPQCPRRLMFGEIPAIMTVVNELDLPFLPPEGSGVKQGHIIVCADGHITGWYRGIGVQRTRAATPCRDRETPA